MEINVEATREEVQETLKEKFGEKWDTLPRTIKERLIYIYLEQKKEEIIEQKTIEKLKEYGINYKEATEKITELIKNLEAKTRQLGIDAYFYGQSREEYDKAKKMLSYAYDLLISLEYVFKYLYWIIYYMENLKLDGEKHE